LNVSARSYATAESANVASLHPLNASTPASANAALPGLSPNSFSNPFGQLAYFAYGVGVLFLDVLLAAWNFFAFLISSGVPFALFGLVLFPGF